MKRIYIIAMFMMLFANAINAQNFVSTAPLNRNVLLEEFTGVYCQYCPEGHKSAKELAAAHPDNIFIANIHAGRYASSDFMTTDGSAIADGFDLGGFPCGLISRTTDKTLSRWEWSSNAMLQMTETAECNVAGQVAVDKAARKAIVTVEVYYTANSTVETNYINVVMLQDNIYSPQVEDGVWINDYCHMHTFRDAITPAWGEEITPTTAGTLVTKTYVYDIPQRIGAFDVKIDDIEFLAFVTEKYQGTATRPVLNVNRLNKTFVTSDKIHPEIVSLNITSNISCTNEKVVKVAVNNGGLEELTSLKLEAVVSGGDVLTKEWNGSILPYTTYGIDLELNIPKGQHDVNVKIVEANGEKFETMKTLTVDNKGWGVFKTNAEEAEMTIELMQDKYGTQITWELLASDYSVLASGGPYKNLSGASATQLHEIKVKVPVDECVMFVIKDSKSNGICCQYGEGYYKILNSKGKVIVNGSGDFGAESSCLVSIVEGEEEEADRLPAPTNVVAMPLNDTELVLMWDAVEGATSYNVYNQDKLVGSYEEISTKVEGLTPGTEYCFTVAAVDKIGEGAKSAEACAKTSGVKPENPEESINELNASVRFYPNPVDDKLYIETEMEVENVVVYDIYGRQQELSAISGQQTVIDVSKLNSGVYFVKIVTENGETVKRILKF